MPTLTGLLLVGREGALRERVPTYEFAFQVMAQQAVRFNEFRRFPLLRALDWLETNFRPYNPEGRSRSACSACRCRWWTWLPSARPWPMP